MRWDAGPAVTGPEGPRGDHLLSASSGSDPDVKERADSHPPPDSPRPGERGTGEDEPRGKFFHTNWTGRGGTTSSTSYNA